MSKNDWFSFLNSLQLSTNIEFVYINASDLTLTQFKSLKSLGNAEVIRLTCITKEFRLNYVNFLPSKMGQHVITPRIFEFFLLTRTFLNDSYNTSTYQISAWVYL